MHPRSAPEKKIFYLDTVFDWSLPHSVRYEYGVRVLSDNDIDPDPYNRPEAVCRAIALRANNTRFDLIVLGNYCGSGLGVVEAMDDAARKKTVIVYNPPTLYQRGMYEKMGVTLFCDRTSLADKIPELLRAAGSA